MWAGSKRSILSSTATECTCSKRNGSRSTTRSSLSTSKRICRPTKAIRARTRSRWPGGGRWGPVRGRARRRGRARVRWSKTEGSRSSCRVRSKSPGGNWAVTFDGAARKRRRTPAAIWCSPTAPNQPWVSACATYRARSSVPSTRSSRVVRCRHRSGAPAGAQSRQGPAMLSGAALGGVVLQRYLAWSAAVALSVLISGWTGRVAVLEPHTPQRCRSPAPQLPWRRRRNQSTVRPTTTSPPAELADYVRCRCGTTPPTVASHRRDLPGSGGGVDRPGGGRAEGRSAPVPGSDGFTGQGGGAGGRGAGRPSISTTREVFP